MVVFVGEFPAAAAAAAAATDAAARASAVASARSALWAGVSSLRAAHHTKVAERQKSAALLAAQLKAMQDADAAKAAAEAKALATARAQTAAAQHAAAQVQPIQYSQPTFQVKRSGCAIA